MRMAHFFPRRRHLPPIRVVAWGGSLCLAMVVVSCGGARQTGVAVGDTPSAGLYYMGTKGYVGYRLLAELDNDDDLCPVPWVATPRAVEGELPPGLSFVLPFGTIEGTPQNVGTWKVRVLLDDVTCGDRALHSVAVPVTFTIEKFESS